MCIPTFPPGRAISAMALGVSLLLTFPADGRCELRKHHLGLALGGQKSFSDDLKIEAEGIDLTGSAVIAFSYRFSIRPSLDLVLDARGTRSSQDIPEGTVNLLTDFYGAGLRVFLRNEGVRPFVQGSLFLARETSDVPQLKVASPSGEWYPDSSGAGFGLAAGLDLPVSGLLSVPIEATFVHARPADDISGLGVTAGLTFNFGDLKE